MAEPFDLLLERAVPKPKLIDTRDGGAVLALALHCMMVKAGFQVVDADDRRKRANKYTPPSNWNEAYHDEAGVAWAFEYRRPGYANPVKLLVSLQSATGRAYVRAEERHNKDNSPVLGLQLQKYVPEPEACKRDAWAGVLANQGALLSLGTVHLVAPLLERLQPEPGPSAALSRAAQQYYEAAAAVARRNETAAAAGLVVGIVVVGVGTAVLLRWRAARRAD